MPLDHTLDGGKGCVPFTWQSRRTHEGLLVAAAASLPPTHKLQSAAPCLVQRPRMPPLRGGVARRECKLGSASGVHLEYQLNLVSPTWWPCWQGATVNNWSGSKGW